MKRASDSGIDYCPYLLERSEIAQINEFAGTEDTTAFVGWLRGLVRAEQLSIIVKILAYGCEYNELDVDIASYDGRLARLLVHMTTTHIKISHALGIDDEFVWNLLKDAESDEFIEIGKWAFLFYARNDNWKKSGIVKR